MKKFLSLFASLVLVGASFASPVPIGLQSGDIDPTPTLPPVGKAPVRIPLLWQDGHELIFESAHADYSIDIVQSGIVVYSVDVDATTTSVELPSWLSGEYELQLHPDGSSYYFYGDITL